MFKSLIGSFKRFIDKQSSGNMLTESSWGRFKVIYRDGTSTTPMSYYTAKNYRNLFGGVVVHITTNKVVVKDFDALY